MALSIKTDEADALARELTAATGETITEAVTVALRERLDRLQRTKRVSFDQSLEKWQDLVAAHRVDDPRTDDEIIGYNEHGLPA